VAREGVGLAVGDGR
jgi:cell shape-determining protein MreC